MRESIEVRWLCLLEKFWSKDDLGEGTRTDPNGAELGAQRTAV